MNLGEKIKKLRELKNYTQQYMADQLDISQSGYGKIERNEIDISISKLEKIAKILDTDIYTVMIFDEKNVFNTRMEKHTYTSVNNQTELFDKIIHQYKEEIGYLKEVINQLLKRDK